MEDNKGIQNRPFGLNIVAPHKTIEEVKKVVKQEVEDITVNPFLNFLETNEKVFDGTVEKEIRKYQAMIYNMGQASREGQPTTTFKMNM
ncbi:hypothetical protein IJ182_00740 [bacterium]|nr:hypothetical protein [bacterium]